MKKKQIFYAAILSFISVFSVFIMSENHGNMKTIQIYDVFDTYCEISAAGRNSDDALQKCSELLHKYHNMWNTKDENSEISRLNQALGTAPVHVSEDTLELLTEAKKYSIDTNGFFDITIGAAADLWNIPDNPRVPANEELIDVIHKTGFSLLEINEADSTAYLSKNGARVTLGGIAKGYAADKLAEIMKKENIGSALINLGGNVYALGKNEDGKPWQIGIADPKISSKLIGTLSISNKAVVTSAGSYRYFESNGVRYHHILNPFTASPANSGLLSVTIISANSTLADMLSTACFVIGYDQSLPLLKEYGVEAIFVTDTNTVCVSSSLSDCFTHDSENYEYKTF